METRLDLPEQIKEKLDELACEANRTQSELVSQILEEHLGDYESRYLAVEKSGYGERAERMNDLYSQVPLYSQNL